MLVEDLKTDEKYYFICDRWLAVEEDDGQIDRVIPVAGKEEMTSFNHLFWSKTRRNLSDGHIWFSVLSRPPRSTFTRVQRLTCCLSLLFCTMATNIMFYKADGNVESPVMLTLGPFKFSLHSIYVGIVSSLIAFPINLLIVTIFRYAGEKPSKDKTKTTRQITPEPPVISVTDTSAKSSIEECFSKELESQMEYLETGDESKRTLNTMVHPSSVKYYRPITPEEGGQVINKLKPVYAPTTTHGAGAQVDTNKKKKKKKFKLPWWFKIIAYILSFCSVGVGFWYCVEAAGIFGEEKSLQWTISFILGIVESIFFTQPIKVFLFALFYALVIKSPTADEDEENPALKENEEYLHGYILSPDESTRNKAASIKKKKTLNFPPPDEHMLRAARELRFKEIKMFKVIREITFYFTFLLLLMMCAYGNQDPMSFYLKDNMIKQFVNEAYTQNETCGRKALDKVITREKFFDWLEFSLIPTLYGGQTPMYDGNVHPRDRGYTADRQNYLVGTPRLRQVRMKIDSCEVPRPMRNLIVECKAEYDWLLEDTGTYAAGWRAPNMSNPSTFSDSAWFFQSALDLDGHPYWGKMTYYGGGGYMTELGYTLTPALEKVSQLKENMWVDLYTRAVFIEFVLYNPNMNMFAVSQLLVEFPPTGGAVPFPRFHIFRLDRYVGTFMYVVMASELLTVAFIVFFIFREAKKMMTERSGYFKQFWNIAEFVNLLICVVTIVMFIFKLVVANIYMGNIRVEPTKFHNLQYPIMWDEIYSYLIGILIFTSNVKFLKILRFNKKMNMLGCVLRWAAKPLANFMLVFGIIFFSFVQFSYLMFHNVLTDFMNIISSMETLLVMLLNKFDFVAFKGADGLFGPIFFIVYTIMVVFILINMMLTIIMETFSSVKRDIAKQSNDYEIVDFMIGRFKSFFGFSKPPLTIDNLQDNWMEYKEGKHVGNKKCDDLQDRMDSLIGRFNTIIDKNKAQKDLFDIIIKDGTEEDIVPDNLPRPPTSRKIYTAS